MRKILTGKIYFFPGWIIREGKSLKAPDLQGINEAVKAKIIFNETNIGNEAVNEIKLMMQNIKLPNVEQKT